MKAAFTTLIDGTVTIVVTAEDDHEAQLLTVFLAQTHGSRMPACVLNFGRWKTQFMARDRVPLDEARRTVDGGDE